MSDSIVTSVIRKILDRSKAGVEKYNTNMDRTDLSEEEWLTHLQEELMDAIIYLEKIKSIQIKENESEKNTASL